MNTMQCTATRGRILPWASSQLNRRHRLMFHFYAGGLHTSPISIAEPTDPTNARSIMLLLLLGDKANIMLYRFPLGTIHIILPMSFQFKIDTISCLGGWGLPFAGAETFFFRDKMFCGNCEV